MSKAFYKPNAIPKLLHRFSIPPPTSTSALSSSSKRIVEIWTTTCVVTNFGKNRPGGKCQILINPANPQLSGVSNFPYFPRGGPVPKDSPKRHFHKSWQPLGYVSNWGGMEIGSEMMYAVSVVDGMVHQLGGAQLQSEIASLPTQNNQDEKCPVGTAVITSAGKPRFLFDSPSALSQEYDWIVHTTPPFYRHQDDGHGNTPEQALASCYCHALDVAFAQGRPLEKTEKTRVGVPLLGAGARGFPTDVAVQMASRESVRWMTQQEDDDEDEKNSNFVVAFGIPEERTAMDLIKAMKSCLSSHTKSQL